MKRIIILASGIFLTGNGKGIKQMMAEDRVKFDRHVLTQGEHEQFKSFTELSPEAQEVRNTQFDYSPISYTVWHSYSMNKYDSYCRFRV